MKQQDHHRGLLELRSIRTDQAIQQREGILNNAVVAEYAEAMQSGATFPPVVVFHDADTHWLADGYHRLEAADEAGVKAIKAEIREGTKRDAILFAVGANRDHGLRRTRADVRRAITTLAMDAEWGLLSDRVIADKVGCSDKTVAAVRKEPTNCGISAVDETAQGVDDTDSGFEIIEDDEGIPASTTPPPAPTPAPKRIGKDGKARAMPKPTAPTTKPTTPPTLAKPKASPALIAMQQAHAVKDALVMLARVEGDLLPEDGHTLMANLRATLERLETRFGLGSREVRDHA